MWEGQDFRGFVGEVGVSIRVFRQGKIFVALFLVQFSYLFFRVFFFVGGWVQCSLEVGFIYFGGRFGWIGARLWSCWGYWCRFGVGRYQEILRLGCCCCCCWGGYCFVCGIYVCLGLGFRFRLFRCSLFVFVQVRFVSDFVFFVCFLVRYFSIQKVCNSGFFKRKLS